MEHLQTEFIDTNPKNGNQPHIHFPTRKKKIETNVKNKLILVSTTKNFLFKSGIFLELLHASIKMHRT